MYLMHSRQEYQSPKITACFPIIKSNEKTGQETSLGNLGYETELITCVGMLFSDWEDEIKLCGLAKQKGLICIKGAGRGIKYHYQLTADKKKGSLLHVTPGKLWTSESKRVYFSPLMSSEAGVSLSWS